VQFTLVNEPTLLACIRSSIAPLAGGVALEPLALAELDAIAG
jgi:uncharacterized membrane protein YidH (DUF202 family)